MTELVGASIRQYAKKRLADPHGYGKARSFFGHVLERSVAAAIVLFYSKNIVSAILRAFVSF